MEDSRIISGFKTPEDLASELSLRPKTLNEYIGQSKVKENMRIFIEAAKGRGEALDHVLLYGPPGLGKTTLAHIIAAEMGTSIRVTSGPAIEHQGDFAAILTNLQDGDVLFIDEIHRLKSTVEEILYPALEDYKIDIILGKGPSAKSMELRLPRFTLIGATTRAGMLTSPLRDRFGIISRLELYSAEDLGEIVARSAGILNIEIDKAGVGEIAMRSRGTPRIANRLLRRVRDYAQIKASGVITKRVADDALNLFEVDKLGLDHIDRLLLDTMMIKFSGRPVGLDTLAAATGEDWTTIEEVYEPFLLQQGLIMRTPRGRVPTDTAYRYMGLEIPDTLKNPPKEGQSLFI